MMGSLATTSSYKVPWSCGPRPKALKVPQRTPRYPKVPQGTPRYPKVPQGTPRYPKVPEATRSYPKLPEATRSYPKLPQATRTPSYPKLPQATPSYPKLPQATPSYPLPEDLDACLWSPEMFQLDSGAPSEYCSKRGGVVAGRDTDAWQNHRMHRW